MRNYFLIFILFIANKGQAQLTYENIRVDYDSAITFKHLKLIPVRYKGPGAEASRSFSENTISFNQALRQNLITVQERGTTAIENVHWLSLYNNSNKNIFISSGEVLAGGRQDRMVSKDTIVRANSGRIDLPVMCVEEGRWSEKDKKFVYQKMANSHLRKTLDQSRSQVMVWKEINRQLELGKIKNKTLSYLSGDKDKKYVKELNEYLEYFRQRFHQPDSNIIGMVCISGDSILGSDILITSHLFYQNVEPLLMGYIDEAMAFGNTPIVPNEKTGRYLDQFLTDEKTQEEFVKKYGKLFKEGKTVIHITTY